MSQPGEESSVRRMGWEERVLLVISYYLINGGWVD